MADESVGAGANLVPGWDDDPEIGECKEQDETPGGDAAREPWWERLGIVIMVLLALVGSALVPPGRPVLAEAPLGDPIDIQALAHGITFNPNNNRLYVSNLASATVQMIDATTNTVVGQPIPVGNAPHGLALNPATNLLYVANAGDNTVSVIDTTTNRVVGSPISVGSLPEGIGINPTTNRIYVANSGQDTVTVINGATGTVIGQPIKVGLVPGYIGVNPTTNRLYVSVNAENSVAVIDGATNTLAGPAIAVGRHPTGLAINPATNRVYVSDFDDAAVTVIDTTTNKVIGNPVVAGSQPFGIAVNPLTNLIYVANFGNDVVTVIDGSTNGLVGNPIPSPTTPINIAVNPATDQIYVAQLRSSNVTVLGVPLATTVSPSAPGTAITATWSSLFVPNGADFLGLFEAGAPNTSPLVRRFTNGTTGAGGPGVAAGSVDLPIQADLPPGQYEVRLIAGTTGALRARIGDNRPVAVDDTYTVGPATTLNVSAPGVLGNDSDADGPALQVRVVTNPLHGTLALQPDGAFTYTPSSSFSGADSFTYRVVDPAGLPATGHVLITVTAAPVGTNDVYTAAQGGVLTVPAPGVLANDTGADPPSLQAILLTNPAHGTLNLRPDGSFSYTPAPGFSGTDSFTYRANDQRSISAPITVILTVTVNDCAPRPPAKVTSVVSGGTLAIHVQTGALNTQQPNPLRSVRFGTLQNAKVTMSGQPIASGQTITVPAGSSAVDFTVERATPGQGTTVPFTVTDGCGEWQTFVGGGPGAGF